MIEKIDRIKQLYFEGGLSEVGRGIQDYAHYNLGSQSDLDYHNARVDNDDRWEYIKSSVQNTGSLIDIGCAEGFFTRKAATGGTISIGIESKQTRVNRARERASDVSGCGFMKWDIGPDNIDKLPRVNVILFMTVHHHWEKAYGLDVAEQMFQVLMDRCDTLIYEPPGDRPIIKKQRGNLNPSDSIDYYTDRLQALYGENIEIVDCRKFSHTDDPSVEREDPVFVIDVSDYVL